MPFCPPDHVRHLRSIPLQAVLPLCGAQPDPHDRRKWRTAQGVLSVTGPKFINWTQGVGGGGAIDLVMHLQDLNFTAALHWLGQHFPSGAPCPVYPSASPAPTFQRPRPQPTHLGRVKRYLVAERALPAGLIDSLIQSGKLYADQHANAVFLLLPLSTTLGSAQPSTAVGAELRGTCGNRWRGLAPGSRKDLGFFSISPLPAGGGQQVILCESAIDAISCFALQPQHHCLSTAGARSNPAWLGRLLDQGCSIYCGFDADPTGDHRARALIARHPTLRRLRPPAHDWNDVLRQRT